YGAAVPLEARRVNRDRAEGVADDVTEEKALPGSLRLPNGKPLGARRVIRVASLHVFTESTIDESTTGKTSRVRATAREVISSAEAPPACRSGCLTAKIVAVEIGNTGVQRPSEGRPDFFFVNRAIGITFCDLDGSNATLVLGQLHHSPAT